MLVPPKANLKYVWDATMVRVKSKQHKLNWRRDPKVSKRSELTRNWVSSLVKVTWAKEKLIDTYLDKEPNRAS